MGCCLVSIQEIEKDYENYSILDLDSAQDLSKLKEDFFVEDETAFASRRVLDILLSKARSVIIQKNYVDDEALHDHLTFYANCFKEHNKKSNRYHFFSDKIEKKHITGFDSNSEGVLEYNNELHNKLIESYLGFVVVRSLSPPSLGRVYIKPLLKTSDDFILCEERSTIYLAGIPIEIKSVPFIEQDERVSCCASASIWVVSEGMNDRFKGKHYSTSGKLQMDFM